MRDNFDGAVAFVGFLLILVVFGLATVVISNRSSGPEILIMSEKFVEGYDGEMLLFVDYTVGGLATNATFKEHQMDMYIKLIEHLEKTGRVRR